MIDWLNLLFNSIWIIAIALALAIFSIAYYQAKQQGDKIRNLLSSRKFSFPLNISGALFCLGMGLTSDKWWEIALWVLLVLGFLFQAISNRKSKK